MPTFKRCIITLPGSDDKDVRVQQFSANGKADDAEVWAPYGMSYNLPEGSLCVYAQVGGDEADIIILPDRSKDRVKDLQRGEIAVFNPLTKSRTTFRSNGNIETVTEGESGDMSITIKKDWTVTVGGNVNITATGDVDITAEGDMNLTATGAVNITGSTVNLN